MFSHRCLFRSRKHRFSQGRRGQPTCFEENEWRNLTRVYDGSWVYHSLSVCCVLTNSVQPSSCRLLDPFDCPVCPYALQLGRKHLLTCTFLSFLLQESSQHTSVLLTEVNSLQHRSVERGAVLNVVPIWGAQWLGPKFRDFNHWSQSLQYFQHDVIVSIAVALPNAFGNVGKVPPVVDFPSCSNLPTSWDPFCAQHAACLATHRTRGSTRHRTRIPSIASW